MTDRGATKEEIARVANTIMSEGIVDDETIWQFGQGRPRKPVPTSRNDVVTRYHIAPVKLPLPEFYDELEISAPHYFPYVPPEDNAALAPLIEAACGKAPTMKARAVLLAEAGPELYASILAKYGCSDRTLTPGVNPKLGNVTDEPERKTERKPDASNPFSKAGWNLTTQSRLVTAIGFEKASQIAAAAGVKIGATRPVM